MAYTILIALEGVMAEEDPGGLALSQPIPEGRMLFYSLREHFNIVLSTLESDEARANRWLVLNSIKPADYGRLLLCDIRPPARPRSVREAHIMRTRALGYDLRYVLCDDPEVARLCLERGITPLCCPHPVYSRSSFLPDSREGGLSWDAIVAAQTGQKEKREKDNRTLVDDFVEGYEESRE